MIYHNIPPVFDENSEILILGSFPSVKSREAAFFYGNPQNRFWRVLAAVLGSALPVTTEEKRAMLLSHRIALWDVVASCEIRGSSDAAITAVVPNDITPLLSAAHIGRVFTNGGKASSLYRKYMRRETGLDAYELPSTSPANASYSLEHLIERWRAILE